MKPRVGESSHVLAALTAGLVLAAGGVAASGVDVDPGGLFALAALVGLGAVLVQRRTLRRQSGELAALRAETQRLEAVLAAVPDAHLGFGASGTLAVSPRCAELLGVARCERLDDVEAALEPGDAAALHGAFRHLERTGKPFRLIVATQDGARTLEIRGTRGLAPDGSDIFDVLWLRDVSDTAARLAEAARARAAAEAAAAELRAALDALPVPVWLRRADLSLAACNRAYAAALDATPETALAEQRELLAGGAGDAGRALALRVRDSERAQSERRHVVVGGARRLLELTEVPVPETGPDAGTRIVGYALDRTREEELEAELGRHVTAHAAVLEQLGSAIAIYGPDTRLRFYNQAYVHLWGFDEDWLATAPTFAEILEDQRARRRLPEVADFPRFKKERLALFTSLLEPQEDLMHLPDGTTLRMLVVPHPLGGLMFVLEDMTNALALESSYNTLMAVQQETLDSLAEGIAVYGGDGRLKLSNPAFARIWQLTPEDLAGEPHIRDLVDKISHFFDYGENWAGMRDEIIATTLDRTVRSGRLERADGSVLEFANVPLPDGAVLNTFLDITDTVRVEQALRDRNAALEAADRLKAEFIANVSYQLRTPLNAIMGFTEILANQYFGELNARQLEYCQAVLDSGGRLLMLINDILDLATVEAGFMKLDLAPVDVGGLLQNVVALTREWTRKQDLRVDVECPADIGSVDGDEKRLKQALFNLMSNAIKFTPAGGRITLWAERHPDGVVLGVADTGIGIPPEDQARVFGRFERANPQARQPGAGLGLSLVKSIIELHGGQVTLESRPGLGTRVRCTLPVRAPAVADATVPVPAARRREMAATGSR